MKKNILFVATIFIATSTFAQDGLTSKKGEAYIPETGDWALGFNSAPLLDYVGNLFNGTENNSIGTVFQTNDLSVTGKYFVDKSTAYRGRFRIRFGSINQDINIDTSITPPTPSYITNELSTSRFDLVLGAGFEKRKGNTRIQGYFGGEALISFSSSSSETDFALDLNAANPGIRVLEMTNPSIFTIGVRAFIGVEYFIFPKVSVGAEYGWGLGFTSLGERKEEIEWFDGTSAQTATVITSGSESGFTIDNDNRDNGTEGMGNSGQISMFFHF